MAKQDKITLTLDFRIEKDKLQEVSKILNQDVGKGFRGNKANNYLDSAKKSAEDFLKSAKAIYSAFEKPLVSKSQGKELANTLGKAFDDLDAKLFSLQGSIGKTFGSVSNAAALNNIRKLGNEIDKMLEDYNKIGQLNSKSRSIGNKGEIKSQNTNAKKELAELKKRQNELSAEEIAREKELQKIIKDTNNQLREKLEIAKQIAMIQSENGVTTKEQLKSKISGKIEEQQGMKDASLSVEEATTLKQVLAEIRELIKDIRTESVATSSSIEENINQIELEAKEAEEQAKTFKSVMRELGIPMLSLTEIARYMKRIVSYSYEYIKNLDRALTEIAIVSGKSRDEVLKLTDTFIDLSAKTGMAIDDIAKASTIFYQQGLNDEAVKKLTEYTAIFAKISSETVEVASDQITAAINGFNFSVDQAGDVIDKLSVLAAYSAADIDELATAMSKAASQASMAGLSFDQYNAYLATMIEATREAPENIGTSLKTIFSRMQQIKTGENTEDDVDVNQVETALRSVNIRLRDTEGQLRDLGDVFDELGPKWNSLSRNTQAYLGTIIAGTRQQSRFISLMQSWDRAVELTEASQKSAGAATEMHKAAMEGLDAAINELINSWQKFISKLVNGNTFKVVIKALTGVVKWFSKGNSGMKLLATAMLILNAKTLIVNRNIAKTGGAVKNLNTTLATLKKKISEVITNTGVFVKALVSEGTRLEIQKAKVDSLTQSYTNLTNAKLTSAGVSGVNAGGADGVSGGNKPSTKRTIKGVSSASYTRLTNSKPGVNLSKSSGAGKTGLLAKGGAGLSNITKVLGYVQTFLTIYSMVSLLVDGLESLIVGDPEGKLSKVQSKYDKLEERYNKYDELQEAVESNADVYDKLSKKINKSSEEVERLAEAADSLAKAAPGALVGYDANGQPIINTATARLEADNAKKEKSEVAKEQMGLIGQQSILQIEADASNDYNSSIQKGVFSFLKEAGIATATVGGMMVGSGAGALPGAIVTAIGAAMAVIGFAGDVSAQADEKTKALREEAKKTLNSTTKQETFKKMNDMVNNSVSDRIIDGKTKEDRVSLLSNMGNAWYKETVDSAYRDFINKDISSKEFKKKIENLGEDWQEVLNGVSEEELSYFSKQADEISEGVGDKTFNSVEKEISDIVKNKMGISEKDDLFKTIKNGILNAVYNGSNLGSYAAIQQLETKKANLEKTEGYANNNEYINTTIAIGNAKAMSSKELDFYTNSMGVDNIDLFNNIFSNYNTVLTQALQKSEAEAALQLIDILDMMNKENQTKLNNYAISLGYGSADEIKVDELTEEQRQKLQELRLASEETEKAIQNAWNSLDISSDIPWKQLWDNLDSLTQRLQTARETYADIASGKGIDLSQWENFTKLFDNVDVSALDVDAIDAYSNALDLVSQNLTVINGQIYANGEAISSIADLEELAIQASVQATRQELINKRTELEANKEIVDAEIATLEWKIAEAEGHENADELKEEADAAWVSAAAKLDKILVENQGKAAQAMVDSFDEGFAQILTNYNKLITAMSKGEISQEQFNSKSIDFQNQIKDFNKNEFLKQIEKSEGNAAQLKELLEAAKRRSSILGESISNINLKLATLNSGILLKQNGYGSGSGSGSTDKLDIYIGKLKEIYNILNRIEVLEHRLSMLDSYADVAIGDSAGTIMKQRLSVSEELVKQYSFLTSEQKKFTNGYKEFINSVEGLEGVFSFDKYGQIIINWEKYNQLQDIAIDGETTLKEKADDVYDSYKNMFQDLLGDMDNTLKALKKVIDLQKEQVNSWITTEKKAANAVQEVYKKILDDRLKAIDKEIKALDELKKAREEASKERQNSKEVTNLQTDIQRALMDTSGASDIDLIKAKNDLDSKLEQIAEDKYSQTLEEIKEKLNDQKEGLQEEFNELFENLDWLFAILDEDFMTNEESLLNLIMQTDEWNKSSEIQRQQLKDELSTDFSKYMSGLEDGKTIADVYNSMKANTEEMVKLESILQTEVAKASAEIQQTILKWQQQSSSSSSSGGSSGGGGGSGSYSPTVSTIQQTSTLPQTIEQSKYSIVTGGTDWKKTLKVNDKVRVNPSVQSYYDLFNKLFSRGQQSYNPNANFTILERKIQDGVLYYRIGTNNWIPWSGVASPAFKKGGMADFTGPAWLDGTKSAPEAVLNALQTEHFIKFTNTLDKLYANGGFEGASNLTIGTIEFNVDSMSSPEDGKAAFDAFVERFKEIGNQTGLKINTFKNTL